MFFHVTFTLMVLYHVELSSGRDYENYTLYRATPTNKEQLYFFHSIQGPQSMGIRYWMSPGSVNRNVSFIVPPENETMFLKKAAQHGVDNIEVMIKNIQRAFEEQKVKSYIRRNMETFDWTNYYSLESIYGWMEDLASKYSDRVKLVNLGKSFENRNILGLYIPARGKYCNFVEGGMHAREWISPAFVTYLIHKLVTAKDTDNKMLWYAVKEYSWHLFPVVNPDGYVYTHKTDRDWRKNRHRYGTGVGVDLNRNFDYKFGTVGVSNYIEKETYCGPKAFSEPESRALSEYVNKIGRKLMFYMSFHSYGQYFVIPFADSRNHKGNFRQVKKLAQMGLKKLNSLYRTEYSVGTAFDTVGYLVSGNSVDWVKNTFKVPVAMNMELRDTGMFGFALPPHQILPTCEETFACVLEMVAAGPDGASQALEEEDMKAALTPALRTRAAAAAPPRSDSRIQAVAAVILSKVLF